MGISCPYCHLKNSESDSRSLVVGAGSFLRKSDNTRQPRFYCRPCKKSFSLATLHPCYRQKKRELNPRIFENLVSGTSMRRAAFLLKTNRKTIARKMIFLGVLAHHYLIEDRNKYPPCTEIQFDDLETFEHSKLKPLSVIMAVESDTRRILGFRVARMPAKGHLVRRSLKKYGPRKDERRFYRESLFQELSTVVSPCAVIKSDENPHYPQSVKKIFPQSTHKTFKGQRGCVVGQGELKAGGFDPLFSLNHSFAMTRANMHRLFRRTWNTTKKPEFLSLHLSMYALFHNLVLIKEKSRVREV